MNNDGKLSSIEFRNGLHALKIVINNKDLNNLFQIFDKDKDGTISIDELKTTLDHY